MGAINGPLEKTARYRARCSCGIISAMVPLPMTTEAMPTNPARKRKHINMAAEMDRAQAMEHPIKSTFVACSIVDLPQISEAGAKTLHTG
jgi:hypothetical protein